MWIARNRTGDLRCFEMPPRRFHDGPLLYKPDIGFNDDVYIRDGKEDIYSFWAVQEWHGSNKITNGHCRGFRLMRPCGENTWEEYEPKWIKNITWENEPVEVLIFPKELITEVNKLTDNICSSLLGRPNNEATQGDVLVSMKNVNTLLNEYVANEKI